MKKIVMMILGVAFAACAWAWEDEISGYINPYSADTNPATTNASWYTCYFMNLDAIKTVTGNQVTSVNCTAYSTWLQANFSANKAATIANATRVMDNTNASYLVADRLYKFDYVTDCFMDEVSYLSVCFFDNDTDHAFNVIKDYQTYYRVDNGQTSTGWIAAPPDPIEYLTWDESTKALVAATNAEYKVVTKDTATFENGKWYVVTNTIERGTITVNGAANLILCDGASLTVTGDDYEPGICVNGVGGDSRFTVRRMARVH